MNYEDEDLQKTDTDANLDDFEEDDDYQNSGAPVYDDDDYSYDDGSSEDESYE